MILTSALLGIAAGAAIFVPVLVKKQLEKKAKLQPVPVRVRVNPQNPYQ